MVDRRSCLDWLERNTGICRYCKNYVFFYWIQERDWLHKTLSNSTEEILAQQSKTKSNSKVTY
jgi:hypothetical protein